MTVEELMERTKKMTLLYVEDEKETQNASKRYFELYFKTIIVADNGRDGLEKFKSNQIDIVITDILMPNMSGLEMTGEIREIAPDVPIIINSAHSESRYLTDAFKKNVDAYLLKPLCRDQLQEAITICLEK